jgi:predicted acyltransferase
MIIVNTPGDGAHTFSPLLHAKWHGFTPTDLVFPSFLFAVGNAMSFGTHRWETETSGKVVLRILRRTAIIFLLGFLMYWFPFFRLDEAHHFSVFPMSQTRVMGVLQRIALCYGVTALLLHFLKTGMTVVISIALLLIYWALLYQFGDADDPLGMMGNAGTKLDYWIMGEAHIYHGEGVAFEPEGWLSTLPAIGNVVGGFIVGKWIQKMGNTFEGLTKLLLVGLALIVCAYFWDLVFPVNKKLWTSSFVVLTVGIDCILIASLTYVTQIEQKTKWTNFFQVFGKNPLFIYLLSELLAILFYTIPVGNQSLFAWLYQHTFSYAGFYIGSLLFAISFMLLCWLIGFWMDSRKIYIRV